MTSDTNTPLLSILAFLQGLVKSQSELRILLDKKKETLKAILLNPASQFTELVSKCRSIIVAGGTMQPISEFQDQLFISAGADLERISYFSCGHIVPPENVLPLVMKSGPSGKTLDFTFQSRDKLETYQELSRCLINACNIIPGGIVVFFPSYDYESRYFFNHTRLIPLSLNPVQKADDPIKDRNRNIRPIKDPSFTYF